MLVSSQSPCPYSASLLKISAMSYGLSAVMLFESAKSGAQGVALPTIQAKGRQPLSLKT